MNRILLLVLIGLSWQLPSTMSQDFEDVLSLLAEELKTMTERVDSLEQKTSVLGDITGGVEKVTERLKSVSKQLVHDQYLNQERIRAEGDSGIVNVRNFLMGEEKYHSAHYTGQTALHMFDRIYMSKPTIGYGEMTAVLNGIQFRTRYNQVRMAQASATDDSFEATDDIEFPAVPNDVASAGNVEAQIEKMIEYFKAFAAGDDSQVDYKPYFKPHLCYLEGYWLNATSQELDRRKLGAYSWEELSDRVKYEGYTGKSIDFRTVRAQLPQTALGIDENNDLVTGQFTYNILCHPVSADVGIDKFQLIDDYSYRVANSKSKEDTFFSKGARFELLSEGDDNGFTAEKLLDKIVVDSKIPGKDFDPENNPIYEASFLGDKSLDSEGSELNLGYYNRVYNFQRSDYLGQKKHQRGFNDANLYVAYNNREEISEIPFTYCSNYWNSRTCNAIKGLKLSFMIPLEIVYLTPLGSWNPLEFVFHEGLRYEFPANQVTADGRNGRDNNPYNGTNEEMFFWTPAEFYDSRGAHANIGRGAFDWNYRTIHVLNSKGETHRVSPSGVMTVTENIKDVGPVRLRYPVFPVHEEGSSTWKEMKAFEDYLIYSFNEIVNSLNDDEKK